MPGSDAEGSPKTCFVAMPITTPASYTDKLGDPDHFAHVLAHLFTPALQAAGLKVIPPSVAGSEMIHAEIIRNLEQADYVLCDLSGLNPNVLFELGVRTSLDRPVMLVRDNLTEKIPFDLNAINTASYDSSLTPWALATEIPRLASFVQEVMDSGNPGNAMWGYFGLTKRGTPSEAGANPVEAKLDLILMELAKNQKNSEGGLPAAPPEPQASLRDDIRRLMLQHRVPPSSVTVRPGPKGALVHITIPGDQLPGPLLSDLHALLDRYGIKTFEVTGNVE